MPRTDWVDLSKWQGVIPVVVFQAWKRAGLQGVILKVGGGNSGRYQDSCFQANRANASAAGLGVEGYWFNGVTDPVKDAEFAHSVTPAGFRIWADIETENPMPHWSPQQANAFQTRLEQLGHPTGAYMSQSVTFGDWSLINHRPLWVAAYGPASVPRVGSWHAPVLWQHSSSGQLPGYGGRLDVNEVQPGFTSTGVSSIGDEFDMASLDDLKKIVTAATTVNLYRAPNSTVVAADVSRGYWREFTSKQDFETFKALGIVDPDEPVVSVDLNTFNGIKTECQNAARQFAAFQGAAPVDLSADDIASIAAQIIAAQPGLNADQIKAAVADEISKRLAA